LDGLLIHFAECSSEQSVPITSSTPDRMPGLPKVACYNIFLGYQLQNLYSPLLNWSYTSRLRDGNVKLALLTVPLEMQAAQTRDVRSEVLKLRASNSDRARSLSRISWESRDFSHRSKSRELTALLLLSPRFKAFQKGEVPASK
jgi:hypothetical protein